MHTTPYFHATNLPNVRPENLVQIGIGGWQVPRAAVGNMRDRRTNIFTMSDIEDLGMEKVCEMALERAWDGCDAVYMSYDIDSIEAAFVPGKFLLFKCILVKFESPPVIGILIISSLLMLSIQ